GKGLTIRLTPTLEFVADAVPAAAAELDELLARARARDAEGAELARDAVPVGDPDPYRRAHDEDGAGASASAGSRDRADPPRFAPTLGSVAGAVRPAAAGRVEPLARARARDAAVAVPARAALPVGAPDPYRRAHDEDGAGASSSTGSRARAGPPVSDEAEES